MNRRLFVKQASLATAGLMVARYSTAWAADKPFATVRVAESKRKFTSKAVEQTIADVKKSIGNKELAWLFENCFPNTLDTTVDFTITDGRPDTYVITGDIDAIWLRDSSAQVWPYLPLCKEDEPLKQLIKGVINRQTTYILKDPYANAFYKNDHKKSPWHTDKTNMQRGIHERKWEVDSLCYPIRLAHGYWKATGDTSPFDAKWLEAMKTVIKTFKEQQRMDGKSPYTFMRKTEYATDSMPMGGTGYPVRPNGMICSAFRPSDDATVFAYNVPANYFAFAALGHMITLIGAAKLDYKTDDIDELMKQIATGLANDSKVKLSKFGEIFAYEVNGYGSTNIMDDANVPSLLALSYLVPAMKTDETYKATRKYVLSAENPFFFSGKAAEGIGGPHVGMDYIWPMSITMRALTSDDDKEIARCLTMLQKSHAGTGFMHEAFHKDDAATYTRPWFAWANTLFGELILKLYREKPHLLNA